MKKHKFTWIDGLVTVIILALLAGTAVKFLVNDPTSTTVQSVPFQYQIQINDVRSYTVDSLQVGDTLYNNDGKASVGVISRILVANSLSTYTADDGTILESTNEDRYDVVLTLDAQGVPQDRSYKVGTYDIRLNQTALYFTKYSTWNGRIISMDDSSAN